MGRLLCLFRLDFANPADMRPAIAGRPVYLAMAMDADAAPAAQAAEPPAATCRSRGSNEHDARSSLPRAPRRRRHRALHAPAGGTGRNPPPTESKRRRLRRRRKRPTRRSRRIADRCRWLPGCWRGTANQREFREHWLPLRGGLLVGVGHTRCAGQDAELRVPAHRAARRRRVTTSSRRRGQKEVAFKLTRSRTSDGPDAIFTFTNAATTFPQRIIYRRGTEGWLYVARRGQARGRGPQGHLPDAPRRLRERRVHPALQTMAARQSPALASLRAHARRPARTGRCCASRSATSTSRPRTSPTRAVEHLAARRCGSIADYTAAWKLYGKALARRGSRRGCARGLSSRHRGRASARATSQAEKEMTVFARRIERGQAG